MKNGPNPLVVYTAKAASKKKYQKQGTHLAKGQRGDGDTKWGSTVRHRGEGQTTEISKSVCFYEAEFTGKNMKYLVYESVALKFATSPLAKDGWGQKKCRYKKNG